MGLQLAVELVADHARLDMNATAGSVVVEHLVQVAAKIDHDPVAHDLARERGAGGAGNQADAVLGGEAEQGLEVALGPRQGHGDGQFLVLGGVRRVEPAHALIEEEFALQVGGEGGQVGGGNGLGGICGDGGHGRGGQAEHLVNSRFGRAQFALAAHRPLAVSTVPSRRGSAAPAQRPSSQATA